MYTQQTPQYQHIPPTLPTAKQQTPSTNYPTRPTFRKSRRIVPPRLFARKYAVTLAWNLVAFGTFGVVGLMLLSNAKELEDLIGCDDVVTSVGVTVAAVAVLMIGFTFCTMAHIKCTPIHQLPDAKGRAVFLFGKIIGFLTIIFAVLLVVCGIFVAKKDKSQSGMIFSGSVVTLVGLFAVCCTNNEVRPDLGSPSDNPEGLDGVADAVAADNRRNGNNFGGDWDFDLPDSHPSRGHNELIPSAPETDGDHPVPSGGDDCNCHDCNCPDCDCDCD